MEFGRHAPLAAAALRLLTAPAGRRSLSRRSLWSRLASLATDQSSQVVASGLEGIEPLRNDYRMARESPACD
jgi:hypothetical protein